MGKFLVVSIALAIIPGSAGSADAGTVANTLNVSCMVVAVAAVSVDTTDLSRQYPSSIDADALAGAITVTGTDGYVVSLDEGVSDSDENTTITLDF